ncbi:MAG: amidase family protein [Pseudomonadota bacterium]
MTDWRNETAAELGRAIGRGEADPRDLAEAYLAAIDAHPDRDRIYAIATPERARTEAAAAAERQAEGRRAGPLDGVPISWKDNIDSAGVATEAGSRLLAGRVPERDAPVLVRGSAAGLVCLGKTHLSELAFSGLGVNPMTATPPNALARARAPGGSSSGAAVSTALGLAAAGIGSDTGGSVRIPACWNGLVGLKTTWGVLPGDGVVPLAASLDTVGPLTRTVEDAGLLFAALLGEPGHALPEPAELSSLSLTVAETVVLDGCDSAARDAFEAGVERLGQAGVQITRTAVPEIAETFETASTLSPVVTAEAWSHWGAAIEAQPGVMFPMIEARFRSGATVDPDADRRARARFAEIAAKLADRITRTGPLVMPSVACLPPLTEELLADDAFYTERNLLALRNTRLVNLLGLSALTLPLATPMTGLMLVGAPRMEWSLIAAGSALEPRIR